MKLVSDIFRQMIHASSSTVIPVALLTFEHPEWPDVKRYCSLSEDIVSRGNTFEAQLFEVELPDQPEGRGPRGRIQMMGVTLEVEQRLLSVRTSPTVTIEIVLRDDPDTVEITFPEMIVKAPSIAGVAVDMEIVAERTGATGATKYDFSPNSFPGLF